MKLLAIETSSTACSVAMQFEDVISERHVVEPKAHTRVLMPMITGLLDEKRLKVADLDALVLGNGPGSFIGMRIGASVAQGLAFAAGLKIVPVSSLAAVAAEVMHEEDAQQVAVAQDARMNEVYLGCFQRSASGLPVAIAAESIVAIARIELLQSDGANWTAAGAGWQQYPELLSLNEQSIAAPSPRQLPRARFLLGLANEMIDAGEDIEPDLLQPAYLREQVATPPDP
jgi:tRNA threonylcarbamoyladenosine biosynthesis protein TsaB